MSERTLRSIPDNTPQALPTYFTRFAFGLAVATGILRIEYRPKALRAVAALAEDYQILNAASPQPTLPSPDRTAFIWRCPRPPLASTPADPSFYAADLGDRLFIPAATLSKGRGDAPASTTKAAIRGSGKQGFEIEIDERTFRGEQPLVLALGRTLTRPPTAELHTLAGTHDTEGAFDGGRHRRIQDFMDEVIKNYSDAITAEYRVPA